MLEEQIATDIAQAIVEDAQSAGVARVMSAQVFVGQMYNVNEMLLRAQLSRALAGTLAEGAALHLERPELTLRCADCDQVFPASASNPVTRHCPLCGSRGRHTVETGMELGLGEMQAVMPDTSEDSLASKLARAVDEALGPVEKPENE